MASLDDKLTEQFLAWEFRGRGWQLWDTPVIPEPPFRPFPGHFLPPEPTIDDGRRPTVISAIADMVWNRLAGSPVEEAEAPVDEEEPLPDELRRSSIETVEVRLQSGIGMCREEWGYFFASLSFCAEALSYEIVADEEAITIQFAAGPPDICLVRRQLKAFFPEAGVNYSGDKLWEAWTARDGNVAAIVDFGLQKEFMLPLSVGKSDPFLPVLGALEGLESGEVGAYQVLFEPVRHPWADSVVRSVSKGSGEPFFDNAEDLFKGAKQKVSKPLYSAVLRVAAKSESEARTLEILSDLAGALRVFDNPAGNALFPLPNDEYPVEVHQDDFLRRETRRSGMIVNADELSGLVHIPSEGVRSPRLFRRMGKTKAAPQRKSREGDILLGHNAHLGVMTPVSLSSDERVRHMHVIGASGTGKSTLLYNLICQDIEEGRGVAVLDPHGDLVESVLGSIPESRVGDVVLLDPSDVEYPIGFNILFAHSELEKTLLASDLVSVFERLSSSWGDQMGSVLQNAILAFLESDKGGSLADLRRFLLEPSFREEFLATVRDPEVTYYWRKGFPLLSGNRSIGPVLTRLESFLAPKSVRYMVSQTRNRLDFADILDSGKIFLAKLAQGAIGKENSYLLGTLLVSKLQQTAMARQGRDESARRDFFLYVDEFHNFITPSMAEILTGARKYRLGLVLAHQEMRQLDGRNDVLSAVLSSCHTRVAFRVGDADARTLERGLSSFTAMDLQNLGTGEAVCRIERSDFDFNLAVPPPAYPAADVAAVRRERVIEASRAKYGTPRKEIEEGLDRLRRERPEKPPAEARAMVPPAPAPERASLPALARIQPLVQPASPAPPPCPSPPEQRTPGRGGPQHKYVQTLIKQWAEGMGWRATIEKQVLGGKGSVDVAIEKGSRRIACEISITTPAEQEVANVKKCVEAGFDHVFLICPDEARADKMKEAVTAGLTETESARTRFGLVEDLFTFVQESEAAEAGGERTVKGYKVRVSYRALDQAEREEKERAISQVVVTSLRKLGASRERAESKKATQRIK